MTKDDGGVISRKTLMIYLVVMILIYREGFFFQVQFIRKLIGISFQYERRMIRSRSLTRLCVVIGHSFIEEPSGVNVRGKTVGNTPLLR